MEKKESVHQTVSESSTLISPSEISAALMHACQGANWEIVECLLDFPGIDLSLEDGAPNHFTATMYLLSQCVLSNDSAKNVLPPKHLIEKILNHSPTNQSDKNLCLWYYVEIGDEEKVNTCLQLNCDPNVYFKGDSLLTLALKRNFINIAKKLLSLPQIDVNKTDLLNESPLLLSLKIQNDELFQLLLKKENIDLKQRSFLYGTALTYSIFKENFTAAQLLLDCEKQFNSSQHPGALIWAIRKNQISLIKQMIQKGADIDDSGEKGYEEPPSWAFWGQNEEKTIFYAEPYENFFDAPIVYVAKQANPALSKLFKEAYNQKALAFIEAAHVSKSKEKTEKNIESFKQESTLKLPTARATIKQAREYYANGKSALYCKETKNAITFFQLARDEYKDVLKLEEIDTNTKKEAEKRLNKLKNPIGKYSPENLIGFKGKVNNLS